MLQDRTFLCAECFKTHSIVIYCLQKKIYHLGQLFLRIAQPSMLLSISCLTALFGKCSPGAVAYMTQQGNSSCSFAALRMPFNIFGANVTDFTMLYRAATLLARTLTSRSVAPVFQAVPKCSQSKAVGC